MTGLQVLREATKVMMLTGTKSVQLETLLKLIDEAEKQENE